jgi:hypothetical protein
VPAECSQGHGSMRWAMIIRSKGYVALKKPLKRSTQRQFLGHQAMTRPLITLVNFRKLKSQSFKIESEVNI